MTIEFVTLSATVVALVAAKLALMLADMAPAVIARRRDRRIPASLSLCQRAG